MAEPARAPTWTSPEGEPAPVPIGAGGWLRVGLRGLAVGVVVFGGLLVLLLARLAERPLFGLRRPFTPWITVGVCRAALVLLGIGYRRRGAMLRGRGAIVSNHVSWLDIFVLNAGGPVYFVSKSEVADWPGIGWLARATGTLFIRRDAREARLHNALFEARLRAGHRLCFFPEGTSSDGRRVLPFKPTLFAAFFAHGLAEAMRIQPATLAYHAPAGEDPRFYGWWGAMDFGPHLLRVLAARRQGRVEVVYHPPVRVEDYPGRKELARDLELAVTGGLPAVEARLLQ